ncbi:hypothetical protein Cgig2_012676 [Carnegiea gigantea]|uniref:Uncharacterized protein n=1 Tax=Carnegiea gigantea TaxID=171969 RepID=A0A9Q1K009_9CARY|nr:hypothetical protein Cgig2_012676 [Carnegiea gigantea]
MFNIGQHKEDGQRLGCRLTEKKKIAFIQGRMIGLIVCCRYSLIANATECFTKKPAEVLVAAYCYFEARIKGKYVCYKIRTKTRISLVSICAYLENSTFGKFNKIHALRSTEPEDIGHIPNGSRDDEYYHDESDGLQPYFCRGRCVVREEKWATVTRFINKLRDDLKGEVSLHHLESLMEAYQKALEIGKYKKPSYSRRWVSPAEKSKHSKFVLFQKASYPKGQSQNSQFVKSNV